MSQVRSAPSPSTTGASVGLHITIRIGRGTGPTTLAAFDAALMEAGVADRNLLRLSSIIPPGSTIERTPNAQTCPGGWGDRLYVVMAEERVERPHEEAWAGVGWCQADDTGQGLFVEHHGHSRYQVETDLYSSLEAIRDSRPGPRWGDLEIAVAGTVCEDEPVCALAVACYQAEPWRADDVIDLRSQPDDAT